MSPIINLIRNEEPSFLTRQLQKFGMAVKETSRSMDHATDAMRYLGESLRQFPAQRLMGRTHDKQYQPRIDALDRVLVTCVICKKQVSRKDTVSNICKKCLEKLAKEHMLKEEKKQEPEKPTGRELRL